MVLVGQGDSLCQNCVSVGPGEMWCKDCLQHLLLQGHFQLVMMVSNIPGVLWPVQEGRPCPHKVHLVWMSDWMEETIGGLCELCHPRTTQKQGHRNRDSHSSLLVKRDMESL